MDLTPFRGPLADRTLYYGDCLDVMRRWGEDQVDMIYLDPPFNSNQNYNIIFEAIPRRNAQLLAFSDTWNWGEADDERVWQLMNRASVPEDLRDAIAGLETILRRKRRFAYLAYMAERLLECKVLLKRNGSIFLHCDPTMSHYLKIVMDAIFGERNFLNEIVWRRTTSRNDGNRFGRVHDIILFYRGGGPVTWNRQFLPRNTEQDLKNRRTQYRHMDDDRPHLGVWSADNLTADGRRTGESGQPWRGISPGPGGKNHWRTPTSPQGGMYHFIIRHALVPDWPMPGSTVHERLDALDAAGLIYWPRDGRGIPRLKRFWKSTTGKAVTDVFTDFSRIEANDVQKMGYPTQKPIALLKRLILATTNPRDLVLDPFCGCGTTIHAAEEEGRRWAGVDISSFAIETVMKERLNRFNIWNVKTDGIPVDYETAKFMAAAKGGRGQFESWAITQLPGLVPNEKKGGDGGKDGVGCLLYKTKEGRNLVLAEVKSGRNVGVEQVRAFRDVIRSRNAAAGVFVVLRKKAITSGMMTAAQEMGRFESSDGTVFRRLQIWCIEEWLNRGKGREGRPRLPAMMNVYNTGHEVAPDPLLL